MAFDFNAHRKELLFVPLGGANEIGMNLNLYHYEGKWLMVDFGIGFPDLDWLPGVNVVVPDIDFIERIRHDIVGLILTHAHEDHLGAAPYFWNELECPVYATPFTAAFLKAKLAQERGLRSKAVIREVQPGSSFSIGPFSLEMIGLTHSIPEMQAIAIGTEKGVVLHTGDWKFDPSPMVGSASDEAALQRYGEEGVLAMVCDSTNVFVEGISGSEGTVRENLAPLIAGCEGRVIVSTFASNVARLETIVAAAQDAGREIVLCGRSLWRIVEAARTSGYLQDVEFHQETAVGTIPRHETLIICTGCQGEPLSALPKIARGEHQHVKLVPGDTVIYSARTIPGNEKRINYMQNMLVRKGIEVITDKGHDIHVSGHPARDELAQMYSHVRPHIAIPVHGEARHLHEHAKLAKSLQVPVAVEPYNGAVIRISKDNPGIIGEVETGYTAVDGRTLLDSGCSVIRMRRRLQEAGVVSVVLAVDEDFRLQSPPAIIAPGALDPQDDADIFDALREAIEEAMQSLPKQKITTDKAEQAVRTVIRRLFKQEIGKKPVIMVALLHV